MGATTKSTTETRLATLEERQTWIQKVGWWIAGGLAAALVGLATWWIPREMDRVKESIHADTAAQLQPVLIDLARVKALLQLKQTSSVSDAVRLGVDFAEPKAALAAVKAITDQATAEHIKTEPSVLVNLNSQVKASVGTNLDLIEQAWPVQLAILGYRSSLNGIETHPSSSSLPGTVRAPSGFPSILSTLVSDSKMSNTRAKLDDTHWRNVVFTNVVIEYGGGPIELENVRFVNCTFRMQYTSRASQLLDAVWPRMTLPPI